MKVSIPTHHNAVVADCVCEHLGFLQLYRQTTRRHVSRQNLILLQYRRIFAGILMQRITAFGLALIGASGSHDILPPHFLICVPVAAFWDDSVEGRCLSSLTVWYVMASFRISRPTWHILHHAAAGDSFPAATQEAEIILRQSLAWGSCE